MTKYSLYVLHQLRNIQKHNIQSHKRGKMFTVKQMWGQFLLVLSSCYNCIPVVSKIIPFINFSLSLFKTVSIFLFLPLCFCVLFRNFLLYRSSSSSLSLLPLFSSSNFCTPCLPFGYFSIPFFRFLFSFVFSSFSISLLL